MEIPHDFKPKLVGGIHMFLLVAQNDTECETLMADLGTYLHGLDEESAKKLACIKMKAFKSGVLAKQKNVSKEYEEKHWQEAETHMLKYFQEFKKASMPHGFNFSPEKLAKIELEIWKLYCQENYKTMQDKLTEKYQELYGIAATEASAMSYYRARAMYYYNRYKKGEDAWMATQAYLTASYEILKRGLSALAA